MESLVLAGRVKVINILHLFFSPSKYKIWDTHLCSKVHILSTILCNFHVQKIHAKVYKKVCL